MKIVMGNWPPEVHCNLDQIKRIEAGKKLTKKLRDFDEETGTAYIEGSSGEIYETTLEDCTCVDFERRGLPCKHMYLLASLAGLLGDMPVYKKKKSDFNASEEEERYLSLYLDGQIPPDVYIGVCNALDKMKK